MIVTIIIIIIYNNNRISSPGDEVDECNIFHLILLYYTWQFNDYDIVDNNNNVDWCYVLLVNRSPRITRSKWYSYYNHNSSHCGLRIVDC